MFGRKQLGNESIPQKNVNEIAAALAEHRPARFHGGCHNCLWRLMNTTHDGIAFCRGCKFFAWDRDLPDLSRQANDRPRA